MKKQVYPSPQDELTNAIAWTINTVLTVDQCNDVLRDLRSLGYEIRPSCQPAAQEPDGWVSVEDRLPDTDGLVLVWRQHPTLGGGNGQYEMCSWVTGMGGEQGYFDVEEPSISGIDITHWMPLPTPPKPEADNG